MPGMYVRDSYLYNRSRNGKFAGMEVQVPGKVHFVVPTTAYDADYAVSTAAQWARENNGYVYDSVKLALDACVDGRGDAIVPLPGTHTVSTASLAMSKTGVKIIGPEVWMGLEVYKPSAILTTSIAGDEIMNVTAPDCGIIGMTIVPITQSDALDLSAAADGFIMDRCFVDLFTPAVHTSTIGITLAAAENITIRRTKFVSDGAQGNAIVATGAIQSLIEDCLIYNTAGTWASAIICGAATTGLWIVRNHILSYGTALTAGVNGTGATIASGVQCISNQFGSLVTVPVDNFDAGECELSENYQLGVGATDGGALIVAIT